jgi:ribosomal protein L24
MQLGMNKILPGGLKDGDHCEVISGTHKGKAGRVSDLHTSKTGHVTITVEQKNGVCFKTLARNARKLSAR